MINPFNPLGQKTAYDLYQEDKKNKKPSTFPLNKMSYANPNYTGNANKSYQWQKDLLKPLPTKTYGKSYDDKFNTWAASQGLSESEASQFKTWMDSREDDVKSSSDVTKGILGSLSKVEQQKPIPDVQNPFYQAPKETPTSHGGLSGLFDKLKNSQVGRAIGSAEQFINPFDSVSADQAVKNYLNHKQSNVSQEVARGMNRAIDSATLGAMSNLDKKVNNRTPYYNSERPIGQGGVTDMLTSGIGYLVPGLGAVKGAKAIGLGAKEATGLARLAQIAKEGAATGGILGTGEVGIREALNPKDQNYKDNLKTVLGDIALGGIGDPLVHGAQAGLLRGLSRFAKGDVPIYTGKPSEDTLSKLAPQTNNKLTNQSNSLYDTLMNLSKQSNKLEMSNSDKARQSVLDELNQTQARLDELAPHVQGYQKEFNDAVQQQYNYLKNSMGKGTTPGGLIRDREGYVTGAYGRVSNNPKWYQDFYAANNRKPNNKELWNMAQDHVLNGFTDEVGHLPPWSPKAVQEIDDQIANISNHLQHDPSQAEALNPILNALNEDRSSILKQIEDHKTEYQKLQQKQAELNQKMSNTPDVLNRLKPISKKEVAAASEKITPGNDKFDIVPAPINGDIKYNPGDPLPDTVNHIDTKTKKEVPTLQALKDKAYIKTIDNLHPLNQFDKTVEKVLGQKLKPSESTYTLGLNSRGSDMISKQILTKNLVNKNGEVVGQSLKDIASQIPKGKVNEFEDYLINKHAITRQQRGEKVFPDEMQMNAAKSEAKVKAYEEKYPQFKDIAKQYYDFNNKLGKTWLVDNGILSQKQWDQYLEANPHYVPMNRMFKDIERSQFGNGAKKGFANQSNPIKKAIGSQRKIVSPLESTIEHADKYVKTAKRNEVMQTLIKNVQKNPEAFKGFAEIVPTKETPQDIVDTLNKDGVDGVINNFNQGFEQKPDLTKGNIVFGHVDGKKVHVKVHDPQLLEALTNLQPKAQNTVIHAIGQLTRGMKVLTTGFNPVFSLTRNIFRDIPTAYVNSKTTNNPAEFAKDLVHAVISVTKNGELYRSFKAVGGGHASPISSGANLLAQSKRSILPKKGIKPILGKGLGALESLNNAVESAPRLAEFKRSVKKDPSYDGKMKGLFEANDVTVNFNKYGTVAKDLDAFVPYLNAALQGLEKTARVAVKNPVSSTLKAFTAITIPSIVLYSVNHNDPNYQQLSEYIKDNNFLIPNGDGTFTKIPKPRELGIFGSGVERLLRQWNDQDPKALEKFGQNILENFAPPTRTVLDPITRDIPSNKNFSGVPIVPGDLQNLSPENQYDARTSELAKKLGKLFHKSPKDIDYLIQSYGGGLAELGLPALTKDATIGNTLKQKVTADPVFSNDILSNFYDLKTKLDQAHTDYSQQGVKSPNLDERLRKIFSKTSRSIGDVRKEIKSTQGDNTLNPTDRLKKIRDLQQQMNQIAQDALNESR